MLECECICFNTYISSINKSKKPVVNTSFVAFLRATLGEMAGTGVIDREFINFDFWTAWPRKFYNVKSYDLTKDDFEKGDLIESGPDEMIEDHDNVNQTDDVLEDVCLTPPPVNLTANVPVDPPSATVTKKVVLLIIYFHFLTTFFFIGKNHIFLGGGGGEKAPSFNNFTPF